MDWSLDPLAPEYPHNSPYAFSENRVVDAIELEGLEKYLTIYLFSEENIYEPKLGVVSWSELYPGEEHGPRGDGTSVYNNLSSVYDKNNPYLLFGTETLSFSKYYERGEDGDVITELQKGIKIVPKVLDKTLELTEEVLEAAGKNMDKSILRFSRKGAKYAMIGNTLVNAITSGDWEEFAKEGASLIPLVDEIMTIIEDGKNPEGLTNLSTKKLKTAYETSYNQGQTNNAHVRAANERKKKAKKDKLIKEKDNETGVKLNKMIKE